MYLAHDTKLDRDIAFALIKTDGLDADGLTRIRREAQAMARLGDHPNIVAVYDIGEEDRQPYIVSQYMAGGDLSTLLQEQDEHRLPIDVALRVADDLCQAIEHAHSQGVIHRDLKPGNVWLTGDGTAKLGDFGLAIALDRSRLTQAGMMVGTVAYMAPEQALGGEVTLRSDLYSLGCLLYELVTGRPPFVGDESVAIISQHLNTPPVAPSWHRTDCLPALEALILRLLEKEPDRRPAAAVEVRQIIRDIATTGAQIGGPTSGELPPGEVSQSPIYRRAFVGREAELRQLQTGFDQAVSGQGGLAMVVGEPGIGKTAICEQLATYVGVRGGKVLVGHCYEEGSLSLPYLPFVEALRSYVLARNPEVLKVELGTGAAEVARIISEIRDRVAVELRPAGDPDDDRWRLLQAVTDFLRNAAGVQPLLLVLEDLHWADRGTLDLLLHLARNLAGARVLVVGTYRDVEVDRAHPLSATLAELRRVGEMPRVILRGLTVDEVHRMINALQGQEIRWSFAEAVHRQTEGNPLFIQEALRYLVEEGLIVRKEGRWEGRWRETGEAPPELSIPEGLRDVVGKRLSRLSEPTNQVLSVAAVVGREFRLDVLQLVAGLEEEPLIAALEEAQERAVIEERAQVGGALVFRFTHAFFRQTLYEEIFAARRIRWHQQVARALEKVHARRLDEHAAELAEHYAHSSDRRDLRKAVAFAERAGQRAMSVFAYGEAVRHFETALKAQDVLDPDDRRKRCDLLLALAEVAIPAGEPQRAAEAFAPEALRLAEELDDAASAFRACWAAMGALFAFGLTTQSGTGSEAYRGWVEQADRWAAAGTVDRVQADIGLADVLRQQGREPEAWNKEVQAFATAQALDDEDTLLRAGARVAIGLCAPVQEHELRLEAAEVVWGRSFPRAGAVRLSEALRFSASAFLTWGDRSRAEAAIGQAKALAERAHDPSGLMWAMECDATLATLDGRLDIALRIGEEIQRLAEESGSGPAGQQTAGRATRRALILLGRSDDALSRIANPPQLWAIGGVVAAQRAILLAHAGQAGAATELIDQFLASRDLGDLDDRTPATLLRYLLEAAVAAQHRDACKVLEPRLSPLALLLFTEPFLTTCMGRALGGAAVLLGEPEKARAYYAQALDVCTRVRFRPELALTRLDLAELLLEHHPGERGDALDHLDFAIQEFEAMKMAPSLERAVALRQAAQA